MTREEQDAWDEHEAYLIAQGQQDREAYLDRAAYLDAKNALTVIANQAPWED